MAPVAGRPDPDADALWARVVETVRPLKGRRAAAPVAPRPTRISAPSFALTSSTSPPPRPLPTRPSANTLDARWDERLRRGIAAPDVTIDLHGHTLAAAHDALEAGLGRALARGARLVLLVTGRAPPPDRSRLDSPLRGVIRASVTDWLHHSPHAGRIAAVRAAHPRHGGSGALYLVLRRRRDG